MKTDFEKRFDLWWKYSFYYIMFVLMMSIGFISFVIWLTYHIVTSPAFKKLLGY